MTGGSAGVRESKSFQDYTIDLMINQEQNFIGALKVTGTQASIGGLVSLGEATGGGAGAPVGSFLETGGGTMIGPIAYFPGNVEIDSDNNINIGLEQGSYSTYVKVTSVAATDDLETIIGAAFAGQFLVLQGTSGKTITLKTTGNIIPPGAADFDIVDEAIISGIFDPDTNKWIFNVISGSGGTSNQIIDGNTFAIVIDSIPSFSVTLNGVQKFSIADTRIDLESLEVFGVEKMWFDDSGGSPTFVSMGFNGASFFDINVITDTDAINITFAGGDGFRFLDGQFQMFSDAPNIRSPTLTMFRDDPSPGINDALGDFDFDGRNGVGDYHAYASILGGIGAITNGSEKGQIVFQVAGGSGTSGGLTERLRLEADFTAITNASLRFDSISAPSTAFTTATQGQMYAKDSGGGVTVPYWRDDAGTETSMLGGASNQIIDDNTFAIVIDAAPSFSVTLDGTQAFSIQPNRVDFEDQQIFGIEELRFNDDPGTGEFATMGVTGASIIAINILADTDALDITHAGDLSARFQDGRLQLLSASPNTLSASLSMFKDDPSPLPNDALADIDFDGRDTAANFTTYASILGGIEVATSGAERGRISFQVTQNGSLQQRFRINLDSLEIGADMLPTPDVIDLGGTANHLKDIYLRDGFQNSKLYFDYGSGDTYITGSGTTGRINIINAGSTTLHIQDNELRLIGDTYLMMDEVASDPSAGTTSGKWYVKTVGGLAKPFFIGDGTAAVDLSAGGGGSQTPWTSDINANSNNLINLEYVQFLGSGSAPSSTTNRIWATSFGLHLGSADPTDYISFALGGSIQIQFDEDGEILFADDNHTIIPSTGNLKITLNNASHEFQVQCGTTSSNANFIVEEHRITVRTEDADTLPADLQLIQNHNTPANFRTIAQVLFIAENSSSVDEIYGIISCTSNDITNGTEDGLLQLGVVSDGVLNAGFEIQGADDDEVEISFFGSGEFDTQRNVSGSRSGNAALLSLLLALDAYGLINNLTSG